MSESSRDIKGIMLTAGSVHLQAREWQFDPDSACKRQFPLLPPTAAIRYSLGKPLPKGRQYLWCGRRVVVLIVLLYFKAFVEVFVSVCCC